MNNIGTTRLFFIVLLAVSAGALYYYASIFLEPKSRMLKRSISAENAEISKMSQDIQELRSGYKKFVDDKDRFELVRDVGFFEDQDRLRIQSLITTIQEKSRVLSARYKIQPVEIEDNKKAEDVSHQLISTPMEFTLEALEDKDIYDFFFMLTEGFPGHIEVQAFNVERKSNITQPMLRRIGSGVYDPIVTASIKVVWRNMVENNDESKEEVL